MGNSTSSIYAVGDNGSIAHYNGTSWRKIESGTDLTLSDVYGNNYNSVYISGTDISTVSGVLAKWKFNPVFLWSRIPVSSMKVNSLSNFMENSRQFGLMKKEQFIPAETFSYWNRRGEWDYVRNLPENYIEAEIRECTTVVSFPSIRGNSSNDYIIAGDRNTLRHYNGKTWKQLGMAYDPNSRYIWYEVEQKDNLIVAVGRNAGKAIIIKLKR
ncbi:MAG: hypothetical protein U5K00_23055 [Melioribacteraceae bacterium]|nr:hypothetical protein [Melioribacteraceae bacterium]